MPPRTQIIVRDTAGAQIAFFTLGQDSPVRSVDYSRTVNGVGQCAIEFADEGIIDSLFGVDYQIEIRRRDPDAGIDWYTEGEYFWRGSERFADDNNQLIYQAIGTSYNFLLDGAVVAYNAGTAPAAKNGIGETVIKQFVDENIGPGATSPPRLYANVKPGLAIEADATQGANWQGDRAYTKLLDVCQDVAITGGFDFDIVGTGAATFEFRVYYPQRGFDRTTVGLNPATGLNGAGNRPAQFSIQLGNMIQPRLITDRTADANAIIVIGQGAGGARTVVQRTFAGDIVLSPWNRREAVANASNEAAPGALNAVGDRELLRRQRVIAFDFEALQTPASAYGRDYHFGDLVTARWLEVEYNLQITGVKITVDANGERVDPQFTDVVQQAINRLDALERMANEIGGINSRLRHLEALERLV
jgi:hypothetical protein